MLNSNLKLKENKNKNKIKFIICNFDNWLYVSLGLLFFGQQFITKCSIVVYNRLFTIISLQFFLKR